MGTIIEAMAPVTMPPILVAGSMATNKASSRQLVPKFAASTISLIKPIALDRRVKTMMEIVPMAMDCGLDKMTFMRLTWFFKRVVLSFIPCWTIIAGKSECRS